MLLRWSMGSSPIAILSALILRMSSGRSLNGLSEKLAGLNRKRCLPALLSVLRGVAVRRSLLVRSKMPPVNPLGDTCLLWIRPIPRKKDEELRTVCPAGSTLLNIPGIQEEAPVGIGDRLANRIVLGHRVKRIHAVPAPESHHDGPGQWSLGLRIDNLPPVWPSWPIKISVPSLSLLRESRRRTCRDKRPTQHNHPEPGAHRPPGVAGFIGRAPRLSSSNRISSEVSGSSVGGKSWAALSIATKVLKASARSS